MDDNKHKTYSHSITELVRFQHELDDLKNQADEKEIQVVTLQQEVVDIRKQIEDKAKEFQTMGEQNYPLSKIEAMIASCTDDTKLILLHNIRASISDTGYTEAIITQLYTIDSEVNEFIQQKFQLNFFGKIDSLLSKITGTE